MFLIHQRISEESNDYILNLLKDYTIFYDWRKLLSKSVYKKIIKENGLKWKIDSINPLISLICNCNGFDKYTTSAGVWR